MKSYTMDDWELTAGEVCPYCGGGDVREIAMYVPLRDNPAIARVPCACVDCGERYWLWYELLGFGRMDRTEAVNYWWRDPELSPQREATDYGDAEEI